MKNNEYWQKRFIALEDAQNQYSQKTFRNIEKEFDKAQRQIQAQIDVWYQRFADNNGVSMQEARRLLNADELKELKWDVQEYIKYGKENAFSQEWLTELENASAKFHISRLEALKLRTQQSLEVAYGNELDAIDGMLKHQFTDGYYHSCFELMRGMGVGWDIGQVDEKKLSRILSNPWAADGKTFSDRIWQSKTQMVNDLHQQLTRACLLGKAPDQTISSLTKYVKDKTKNARYQAGRLVMTESAWIGSAAQQQAFNDLDVEEFEVVATLDSHTSETCQEMDGKHFPMKEYQISVTAPPFHCFCRSCTAPYFNDEFSNGERAARDEDGKTYFVPESMKYPEWKEAFVDGGDKSELTPIDKNNIIDSNIQTIHDVVPAELQASKDYYDTWNQNKIKDFAQQHLNNIGLGQFKVKVQNMRGANGACFGYLTPGSPIQYTEYKLRSTDPRNMSYKVKTALHESYHLKADGLAHDRPSYRQMNGYSISDWSKWEETFTECSAHYMAECIGIKGIAPSYASHLVETLPKLKASIPEFASCSTITDFGKIAYKYPSHPLSHAVPRFLPNSFTW